MKREEVKTIIQGITDEQLDQIMDLHGADIERHKQTISTLTTERDAARGQLTDANKKLEGYDPDWKQKAVQAQQQAQQEISALKARHAAANAAAGLKFTSDSARRAFLADLAEKQLPLQENATLTGHFGREKAAELQRPCTDPEQLKTAEALVAQAKELMLAVDTVGKAELSSAGALSRYYQDYDADQAEQIARAQADCRLLTTHQEGDSGVIWVSWFREYYDKGGKLVTGTVCDASRWTIRRDNGVWTVTEIDELK